jgi:hypothetical protein
MQIENSLIRFEFLSESTSVGETAPVSAKIKSPQAFASSNAPGISQDLELKQIEAAGLRAVQNFNSVFA